ncbi:MAG: hypothetical protein AWU57_181 [Marinobacter sp. T13-3]|nr:MAG: hypothetical protein AWU57_181 [Marinobacter sp. T13-3]
MPRRQLHTLSEFIKLAEFNPTDEQQAVVDCVCSGQSVVVKAFAGSGKTATGVESARQSKRRGRMVVFNNAARWDAKARMPEQIVVTTGHGMAHDSIIKASAAFAKKLQWVLDHPRHEIPPGTIANEFSLPSLPNHQCSVRELAVAVKHTLRAFLISADFDIDTHHIPEEVLPLTLRMELSPRLTDLKGLIVEHTRAVWKRMSSEYDTFPIDHDGYLKLLHLRGTQLAEPEHLWLLDEYQDTNPVMDAIISGQPGQKVYIGDPYQQIYGWRGAINAMADKIAEGLPVLPLSRSFRFNHQVAGAANLLLKGMGETTPLVGEPYNLTQMNLHKPHTVLVRNNLTMVSLAQEYASLNQSVYVPKKLSKETCSKVESALALFEGRLDDVKIRKLRELGSWDEYKRFVKDAGAHNPEYRILKTLVERYHKTLPDLLRMCRLPYESIRDHSRRVTLVTAHRAKGREWNYVRLADDLALPQTTINKMCHGMQLTPTEQESVNLLYVALTRCKKGLVLPRSIQDNLAELNRYFGENAADTLAHKSKHIPDDEVRRRTAEFIAKYGSKGTHRATQKQA